MPNLRTGTRQRPSRTSSPFVRTANTSPAPTSEVKKDRLQGSLDAWVEPAPRSPVPSFTDHGMERTALFQDMAPLGSMPPQRLKLKIKGDVRQEKAESVPPSDVATGTPEGTPPVEPKSSEPASQEAQKEVPKMAKEGAEEAKKEPADEPMPEAPPAKASVTPQVRSPAVKQNGTPTPAHSRNTSTSKIIMPSPQRQTQAVASNTRDMKMDKVVRKAIEMAKSTGQEKLAAVISKFYEETFSNPALAVLFDAVITKSETEEQKAQFQKEMKRIRKLVQKSSREGSRSRTMSGSAPAPAGYSAHPPTIPPSTMGGSTIGQQPPPMGFIPPHINTRPGFPPQQSGQISPSPFSAFRGVLHPSPFSPTQSHPASPTYPPPANASFPQGRSGIAPHQQPNHQRTPAPPAQQSCPASQPNHTPIQPPPKSETPQPRSTMVSTRRSGRGAAPAVAASGSAGTPTPTPAQPQPAPQSTSAASGSITVADPAPAVNGTSQNDFAENANTLHVKGPGKQTVKSPNGGKGKRTNRAASVESNSSLSSVDEAVVEKGAPPATAVQAAPDSEAPSRAVSRSATPRPSAGPKAKAVKKGSNLKNLAGQKRGASETIALDEIDEETRERRTRAKANFDKELQDRKADQPPEPDFTSFRTSEEYLEALPNTNDNRSRRATTRGQSVPDTSKVASSRTSTAAATPAPSGLAEPVTGSRRGARQSTQNQRLQVDVLASAPRLEVQTPSTPRDPPSDAESNGDPPPKRRKTARTKFSPVKLPNGVAPPRNASPSRSSPPLDGGRDGKKANRDQCYACGCGGDLICCDMCQNSFHAECWDPPCTDASDDPFQGSEWICTHCRIFDKRKENEERSKKGEPMLIDTSDEESDMEVDDDVPTTPPDWTLIDQLPLEVPLFKKLQKGFKEYLPQQFGLKPMVRDAYDGYVVDTERRFRPTQKAPITV